MTYEDDLSKVNIDGDDFIEKSRSNYFKVKHFDEFEALCKQWNLEILYGEHGLREGRLGFIISDENNYFGTSIHDFKDELVENLEKGEVCIVKTVSYNKKHLSEIYGRIIALDYKGREKTIILNDIYEVIEKEWNEIDFDKLNLVIWVK